MTNKRELKIAIGADPFALDLKDTIKEHLESQGYVLVDLGTNKRSAKIDYYDVAANVAKAIQSGRADRGILLCGTGMGVSIVANKFNGVVASVVESVLAARLSRAVNDSNVLCMGAMLVAPYVATEAVDVWLNTEHTEGMDKYADFLRDAVRQVRAIEAKNMK